MKNSISNYLLVLISLTIGCFTSEKLLVKTSQEIVHYHVSAMATEGGIYDTLIDHQFKELENLELRFVKIHYKKKDAIKYDGEIDILFDKLIINDEESINNKSFSKKVSDEQVTADDLNRTGSVTVNGYLHQRKKLRKLNWDITMKINSDSNNCKLTNSSFTESLISRFVDNTLSGDERAISNKYKEPIEKPLLSKREMTEEAIISVYKKIERQLKKNQ